MAPIAGAIWLAANQPLRWGGVFGRANCVAEALAAAGWPAAADARGSLLDPLADQPRHQVVVEQQPTPADLDPRQLSGLHLLIKEGPADTRRLLRLCYSISELRTRVAVHEDTPRSRGVHLYIPAEAVIEQLFLAKIARCYEGIFTKRGYCVTAASSPSASFLPPV